MTNLSYMSKNKFYSHGKLLLTSEYLVLDGIPALALPTKKGQWLEVTENETAQITWKSIDDNNLKWFETIIPLPLQDLYSIETSSDSIIHDEEGLGISETLFKILKVAQELNPKFLSDPKGYSIETKLEFNRQWGLGSSSTLINNIAQWADVDAYTLLNKSFGGSGYDIASAKHNSPILYTRKEGKPLVQEIDFKPTFKDSLFFIYLNKKQDSKQSIKHYQSLPLKDFDKAATSITEITHKIVSCDSLEEFNVLVDLHEDIISKIIKTPTVKTNLFSDYAGSVKSLGGWGGDFVLATGSKNDMKYFENKGYQTIIPYTEMIL